MMHNDIVRTSLIVPCNEDSRTMLSVASGSGDQSSAIRTMSMYDLQLFKDRKADQLAV